MDVPLYCSQPFWRGKKKQVSLNLHLEMGELVTLLLEASLLSEQGKEQEIFFLSVVLPLKMCSAYSSLRFRMLVESTDCTRH